MNIINNTDKLSEEIITNLTDLCINNINLSYIFPMLLIFFLNNNVCWPLFNDIFLQQNTGTKEISAASIYHYPFGSCGNR